MPRRAPRAPEPGQSLFDSPLAIATSSYTAPEDPLGRNLQFMDGREGELSPLVRSMHAEFRAKILGEHFPCIGAHAALNDELYRFGFYKEMASLPSTAGLGRDLLHRREEVLEHGALGELDFRSHLHPRQQGMARLAQAQFLRQRLQLCAVRIGPTRLRRIASTFA